ncbi:hypothetical protein HUG17_2427 [Dermatophagoides farinae]|uniref:Uncharacterized protein n=1 Tax=Dermatophagoides farinae TaxID=6954 RepID=A0A9D4SDP4_DERFA|nr:hypothetical protein HUG17_2427 [Dermatophagoides farinae]
MGCTNNKRPSYCQKRSRASTETSAMETIDAGRVEKSLAKLNITSQTKIHDLVPGSDQLKDVYTAYDPSFIKQEIDIFKLTVVETTTKFFTALLSDPEERKFADFKDFDKRMETFVDNLKSLANTIKDELNKPKDQRTKYGLTPFSALNNVESGMMFGLSPPK